MKNDSLLKQPSAWIPVAMSLAALAFLLGYVTIVGMVQHADEGAPARIFQLIMLAQLPIAACFIIKGLPKSPKQALLSLALPAIAWLIPILPALWLESL